MNIRDNARMEGLIMAAGDIFECRSSGERGMERAGHVRAVTALKGR